MILTHSSLPKFIRAYDSEEACLDAIFAIKWPRGFICPYVHYLMRTCAMFALPICCSERKSLQHFGE